MMSRIASRPRGSLSEERPARGREPFSADDHPSSVIPLVARGIPTPESVASSVEAGAAAQAEMKVTVTFGDSVPIGNAKVSIGNLGRSAGVTSARLRWALYAAALTTNSTWIASYGKTTPPPSLRSIRPALTSAVMSV